MFIIQICGNLLGVFVPQRVLIPLHTDMNKAIKTSETLLFMSYCIPPRPTHKDLNLIQSQFPNLYCKVDPCFWWSLPVHVSPTPVNNAIPDKDKIWLATKCMQHGKSPSPSAIHVSDLLFWHEKCSDIWNELVSLVQDVFDGKAITQEFLYQRHN
jgi:hypothetical protein